MGKESPFKFGRIVTGIDFIDRDNERSRIKTNILSSINTIIISPRRWGKSSLMKQVAAEMESEKVRFVFLDMFNIRTEEEFFTTYSREIIKATITGTQELLDSVKSFFQRILPVISFKLDPVNDISIKFDWEEMQKAIDEIINLPEKLASEKKIRLVICIDEFQNINQIGTEGKLEEVLRSYWQHHQNVTYCLYGSKKHMMKNIFNTQSRPFFHFGDVIWLQKVPRQYWAEFISGGFSKTGKQITEPLISEIVDAAENHPEYVQQLAHFTWSVTEAVADQQGLKTATELVLDSNNLFFQEICNNLSITQINLIKAIIKGETQFTSVEVMRKYNIGTPRNVFKNKEILESKDIVDFSSEKPVFSDPFFKIWFEKSFYIE